MNSLDPTKKNLDQLLGKISPSDIVPVIIGLFVFHIMGLIFKVFLSILGMNSLIFFLYY
ncbi:MAG: hypothetical protein LBC07_01975 [Elusimicrobiota bacterium]|jgi:hypothetical protein|nr:hypothetical protein [Elusimicrobiota bacterium]